MIEIVRLYCLCGDAVEMRFESEQPAPSILRDDAFSHALAHMTKAEFFHRHEFGTRRPGAGPCSPFVTSYIHRGGIG